MNRILSVIMIVAGMICSHRIRAQCTIDSSQTVPGVYPDTLAVATVNQPYFQNITFVLITDTLGLTISNFQIVSIVGLPAGLTWQCNNFSNGCNYNPSVSLYGCIGLSGTPLIAGTYNPVVTVVATVQIVGNQTLTYSLPLTVLPDSSSNPGFSMSASSGCEPLTIWFYNNNPGQASYLWDFGDGMLSTLENPPPHTYSTAGTYVVTQTVVPNGSPQYFLQEITVTSIPNNYGAPLDVPDMYFLLYDPSNNLIYDSRPAILNTQPPVSWTLPNISLSSGLYRLHVWDEDGGLFGADDDLGEITFQGWSSSGTASGTVSGASGTLNVNYDILVIPVVPLTATDTITVYPTPAIPLITASGPLVFCEDDSVVLNYADTLSIQWYKDGSMIPGASQPQLIVKNSGSYFAEVSNLFGCTAQSAPFVITVNPKPPKPNFFIIGNTFNCPLTGYMLQWYLNGNPLPGETGYTYTASVAGTYQLTATDSLTGCSNVSDTLYFVPTALPSLTSDFGFTLFPNPASGSFTAEVTAVKEMNLAIQVTDLAGRPVFYTTATLSKGKSAINIESDWPDGFYLVSVSGNGFTKVKRLIIHH